MYKTGPQQLRKDVVVMSEAETARLLRFIKGEGSIERARVRLGIGEATMDSARAFGRMRHATRDKVIAALAREEAKAS